MKYKYIIACIFSLLLNFKLISQKVDTDRKLVSVNVTAFPENNRLKDHNAFKVNISAPKGFWYSRKVQQIDVDNKLYLRGFQKVKENNDFIMDVIIENFQQTENVINNTTETDFKGKKTNYFYHKYSFYIPITVRLLENSGTIIFTEVMADVKQQKTWTSEKSTDYEQVKKNANNFDKKFNELISDYLNTIFDDIPDRLTNYFGYGTKGEWAQIYLLDSKKHPEYQAYKMAFDTMKQILKSVKSGCDVAYFQNKAAGPIKYFEDLLPKLSATDKEQNKLLEATLINLMDLNFFTDNFTKFREYADKLLAMNEKGNNEKYKVLDLERILKRMEASNCKSIYYVRPINGEYNQKASTAIKVDSSIRINDIKNVDSINSDKKQIIIEQDTNSQGKVVKVEDTYDFNQLKIHPIDRVYPGNYSDKDGKLYKGYFVIYERANDNWRFSSREKNVWFMYLVDGKPQRLDTDPTKFSLLEVNGRKFKSKPFKEPKDIFSKERPSVMEVIVENPKVEMYLYQPSYFNPPNEPTPWAFTVKGSDKLVSVSAKDLLWKKKIKEVFADCPAIIVEIESTSFLQLSQSNFINWCKEYENCGK